ncbi:MAG TPA: rhodanese-like domain-containing protein [Gammaproteobacteria bacterium]|jgi:rhodanese-related sulfurtransferase|nr:rhodanese-like domain-containing protein [Gammaproteobacteria bacterium]
MSRLLEFIQHHYYLAGLAVLALVALAVDEALRRMRKYQEVSAGQGVLLINKGAAVLDLRSPAEFSAGHIIHARNLPLPELDARASELDKLKGQPLLLCCKDGREAGSAAARLSKLGLGPVSVLKGGIAAWQQEQFPLERG